MVSVLASSAADHGFDLQSDICHISGKHSAKRGENKDCMARCPPYVFKQNDIYTQWTVVSMNQ